MIARWRKVLQIVGFIILVPGILVAGAMLADAALPNLIANLFDLAGRYVHVSILWFPAGIAAIMLGLLCLRVSGRSPAAPPSAFVLLALGVIVYGVVAPVYHARGRSPRTMCTANQRQIALAAQMYAQEHDNRLPPASTFWTDIAVQESITWCPATRRYFHRRGGFGCNRFAAGVALGSLHDPPNTILTADSREPGMLLSTVGDIDFRRHRQRAGTGLLDGVVLSFADGHVEQCPRARVATLAPPGPASPNVKRSPHP